MGHARLLQFSLARDLQGWLFGNSYVYVFVRHPFPSESAHNCVSRVGSAARAYFLEAGDTHSMHACIR